MLLFAASANVGHMQMRNSQTYLLALSLQMPQGSTLVHLATDWKIVMQ